MAKQEKAWVRTRKLTAEEKAAIAEQCGAFIASVLKPRFLPEIRPTAFNYPVDIFGKWRGSKYSFILRYRSGFPENRGEEFNAPFTRLDHDEEHIEAVCFNVMWRRHTGQWWRVYSRVSLEEALRRIETDPMLQPMV